MNRKWANINYHLKKLCSHNSVVTRFDQVDCQYRYLISAWEQSLFISTFLCHHLNSLAVESFFNGYFSCNANTYSLCLCYICIIRTICIIVCLPEWYHKKTITFKPKFLRKAGLEKSRRNWFLCPEILIDHSTDQESFRRGLHTLNMWFLSILSSLADAEICPWE